MAGEEWIHPGNRLVNITSGELNIVDVTVESESSFHIGGDALVTWRGNTDGGMNGFGSDPTKVPPYFDIAHDATGSLLLSDQVFSRGAGYGTEERTPFIRRSPADFPTTNGDAHANSTNFRVSLDHVTLRDWSWIAVCKGPNDLVCGYYPPVRGVVAELHNLAVSTWHYPGPWTPEIVPTLVSRRHFHGVGHSLLTRAVDVSGATVGPLCTAETSPFTSCSLFSGGWSANGSTGTTVNATNASLPKITAGSDRSSPAPTHAIQVITMPTAESWAMVTAGCDEHGAAVIEVEPGRHYVLQGFIRTNCGGGDGGYGGAKVGSVSVRASFGRFDSTPSGTAGADNTTLLELPAKLVGCPGWEPLMLAVAVPGDAMRLVLHFGATGGAALSVYALSLR